MDNRTLINESQVEVHHVVANHKVAVDIEIPQALPKRTKKQGLILRESPGLLIPAQYERLFGRIALHNHADTQDAAEISRERGTLVGFLRCGFPGSFSAL